MPRLAGLVRLAVDSLIDGVLHEGLSARVVARLARRCADPSIGHLLRGIAADEGRHAAHAWQVLVFCLEQGGAPVAQAVRHAVTVIPRTFTNSLDPRSADGSWEAYGIPGYQLASEEYGKTLADISKRLDCLAGI